VRGPRSLPDEASLARIDRFYRELRAVSVGLARLGRSDAGGPHHLVVFVLDDVAVPHELARAGGDRTLARAQRLERARMDGESRAKEKLVVVP
jgi:hypothetical protein